MAADPDDVRREATRIFETVTYPTLLDTAQVTTGSLSGTTTRIDPETVLRLTDETERVARASTLLTAAQLLSAGWSARSIARLRGISNPSSFKQDRLWAQLEDLSRKISAAREAGQPSLPEVSVDVPLNRTEMRTYVFHDVPTGL